MPKATKGPKYTAAVGRRRSAIANVKLFSGKGDSLVNRLPVDKYFPGLLNQLNYQKPFNVTNTVDKYHFVAKIVGGGNKSQAQALCLAISRCLVKINPETYKPSLRPAGLLTVDSRVRQRRHVGTGGKARRQKQSPKR